MKILLAVILVTVVAQVPGCGNVFGPGGDEPIIGYVEEKYVAPDFTGGPLKPWIVVNGKDYMVPWEFYREVDVGDIVKYEKGRWSIVKKYKP